EGTVPINLPIPDDVYEFHAALEAGWIVEPLVPSLFGIPLLRDPSVVFGTQRGALVRSPDHGIAIAVSAPVRGEDDPSWLGEQLASDASIAHVRQDTELVVDWK